MYKVFLDIFFTHKFKKNQFTEYFHVKKISEIDFHIINDWKQFLFFFFEQH